MDNGVTLTLSRLTDLRLEQKEIAGQESFGTFHDEGYATFTVTCANQILTATGQKLNNVN
jgi:hypothetical protein